MTKPGFARWLQRAMGGPPLAWGRIIHMRDKPGPVHVKAYWHAGAAWVAGGAWVNPVGQTGEGRTLGEAVRDLERNHLKAQILTPHPIRMTFKPQLLTREEKAAARHEAEMEIAMRILAGKGR